MGRRHEGRGHKGNKVQWKEGTSRKSSGARERKKEWNKERCKERKNQKATLKLYTVKRKKEKEKKRKKKRRMRCLRNKTKEKVYMRCMTRIIKSMI